MLLKVICWLVLVFMVISENLNSEGLVVLKWKLFLKLLVFRWVFEVVVV